jgi:hypothetical protein
MAGEPLDIQRLEASCAAARHGLPTAPALRGPWRREGSEFRWEPRDCSPKRVRVLPPRDLVRNVERMLAEAPWRRDARTL